MFLPIYRIEKIRMLYNLSSSSLIIYLNVLAGFYLLGWGSFPPKRLSFPPKVLLKKKFTAISNKDLFDDDFKESVQVTIVRPSPKSKVVLQ